MLRRGGGKPKVHDVPAPAPAPRAARDPVGPAEPVAVTVEVPAPADEVVPWFLDAERWTRFQGRHAWIAPRPQGSIRIDLGNGVHVAGSFVEIAERRVAFTWGREGDTALPGGSTLVTVEVTATGRATSRVALVHDGLANGTLAHEHRSGWRYHLVRLAVAAGGATGDTEVVDLFLAAHREPDATARRGLLERACVEDVEVADAHGDTHGVPALVTRLGRLVAEVPAERLARVGEVERVGSILRCAYLRHREPDIELERGELVAQVDRLHRLRAVSFFESAGPGAPAAPDDGATGAAPSRGPAARPPRGS